MCLWPLIRRLSQCLLSVSLSDTVISDHSQCLDSLSGWPLVTHPLSLSFARRLVEASGLARSFVRVPYIRTRTSPSHSRVPRSLASLSLVSGRSLSSAVALSLVSGLSSEVSRQRSLSRLVARLSLDVPLISPFASSLPSPLSRGSARLHF